jgi:3-oxoacyl-[acyl-carrier protein] reductase
MAEWRDQVAVVTGGARGLGRATAQLLANRGAAVCVNYVARADAAEALVKELRADGARAIAVGADVGDAQAVAAMVGRTEAELGPVTILVNNAGIAQQATLDEFDAEQFARMRQVNVDGVINATRAVMAGMRARHYGRIVNISSVAGIGTAMPGNAFYAATKAAVLILTRRFAMELGPHGITVNAIAPGFVRTDMTEGKRTPEEWAAAKKRIGALAMTGRIGEPEDIANAVAFMTAPESSWITAQVLAVDGGRMDYLGHS